MALIYKTHFRKYSTQKQPLIRCPDPALGQNMPVTWMKLQAYEGCRCLKVCVWGHTVARENEGLQEALKAEQEELEEALWGLVHLKVLSLDGFKEVETAQ